MRANFQRIGAGLVAGLIAGFLLAYLLTWFGVRFTETAWWLAPLEPGRPLHDDHHHDDHDDHDHIDVTRMARRNLQLDRGMLGLTDFTGWTYVPASVVERPGVSDVQVVTRFEGIVTEIHAVPGQVVRPGDSLFKIRLTGDQLAATQADLLEAVQQTVILDQELQRLQAAVREGGLAGRTLLELEYERKRVLARKGTKRQELVIRGLDEELIAQITETEQLVRDVTVRFSADLAEQLDTATFSTADSSVAEAEDAFTNSGSSDSRLFTIERLAVAPGSYVHPGDPLCNLAFHSRLYLEGYAFERDVDSISSSIGEGRRVVAELGEARNPIRLDDLRIIHLDNHVDDATQTYRFYIELKNEILQDNMREDGRRFTTWRWKPGQRGHVGFPSAEFLQVFVLPVDAVVVDGLLEIVFRRALVDERPPPEPPATLDVGTRGWLEVDDDPDEEEYVPVPIRVLHRDRQVVIAAAGEELQPGDVIALNSAYQLLLAMRGGGEGHDHHHDH
jgi:membrane fusion protein, heavy metal efflux system